MSETTEAPGAEPIPPRPAIVTPGRVVALFVSLIGLYVVWPSLVAVFASVDDLKRVSPLWFVVMIAFEGASYVSMWGLIALCVGSRRYFVIGTSQIAGNAVSKIVPGGNPVGAALQYRLLVSGGMDPTRIGTGLTAASLINVATLFAMPVLSLPAILLGMVVVDSGLARGVWLGLGAFVLLVGGGAVLLLADRPIEGVARILQRLLNLVRRRKPKVEHLPERLTAERDVVRRTLGAEWEQAILRSAGNVLFDYLALLTAVHATGFRAHASLVLLAYVAGIVLGMIPITPGGLGFVEAGLTATLVLAGVPAAQATLATLAYRLVSYWLPVAAGPVAYALYRRRAERWAERAARRGTT
ncbi:MAG: lysylphosphatidylglycerol synthase transmembrane domain-containing protein [Planctomycetaceae bacterium]